MVIHKRHTTFVLCVKDHAGSLGQVENGKGAQFIHSHVASPLHHFGKETHDVIELQDWTMVHVASESNPVDVEVLPLKLGHAVTLNQIWEEGDDGWLMTSNVFVIVLSCISGFHFFVIAIRFLQFLVQSVASVIGC